MKQFFKPTWSKILLTILILGLTYFIQTSSGGAGTEEILIGWPAPFFKALKSFPVPVQGGSQLSITDGEPLYHFFIFDIIFWYLLVCLIYLLIAKIRTRKQTGDRKA